MLNAIRTSLVSVAVLALSACTTAFLSPPTERTNTPAASIGEQDVTSPNGQISVTLTDDGTRAHWSVTFAGEEIIQPSPLGFRFLETDSLDIGLAITSASTRSVDEAWEQPWGERRQMREHYNELFVEYADINDASRTFGIRVRAFDDGIGFRYEVPNLTPDGRVSIIDELTEFRIDGASTAWWIESGNYNRYEYIYRTTDVWDVDRAHTPFTFKTPTGTSVVLHEAALVDYAGMWLDQQRPGTLKASLAPWSDGTLVKKDGAFETPWRTVQIGAKDTDVLNSDLILNLNAPNALGDVSWVEPGRYIGIWWCMHIRTCTWGSGDIHGATTDRTKRYIDFAAEHGFDGVLVEGWNIGWDGDWFNNGDVFSFTEPYPDFDLEALSRYALDRNVRLIGHHETSGNVSNYEAQLDDALDLYEHLGIRQIKSGYVADAGNIKRIDEDGIARYEWHDGQFMARHHLDVIQRAASRKISMNPHEPIKDTGLRRTYPNWLSREGARGQEYNAWGYPHLNPPEHTAILPWTRMMSGPMDFTPGIFNLTFDGMDAENRVQTTLAKQLALYVVIYSPIQMAADVPEHYEANMAPFQFIKDVPTDWEQSIAIAGEIGDYVAYARQERGGQDWFIGALTDQDARTLSLPLDFLTPGIRYTATLYTDGPGADWKTNPYPISITTRTVTASDTLTLSMATSGGAAVKLSPAE